MPRTGAPPMIGDTPTTGPGAGVTASRIPGTPRIVPMETTGLLGRDQHDVCAEDRLEHARPGGGVVDPDLHERLGRQARAVLDPPLLEVDRAAPFVRLHDDVRLAALVGHRQQPDAGLPPLAQRRGHLGQRVAGVEHPGADEVGRDVEIAEAEPGRFGTVVRQLVLDPPALVLASPAAFVIGAAAEGVHHAVEIGTDAQSVQRDVVAGVHDRGQVVVGARGPDSAQELRAADTAGQNRNPHCSNLRDILGSECHSSGAEQGADLVHGDLDGAEFDRADPEMLGQVVVPTPGVVLEEAAWDAQFIGHRVQFGRVSASRWQNSV